MVENKWKLLDRAVSSIPRAFLASSIFAALAAQSNSVLRCVILSDICWKSISKDVNTPATSKSGKPCTEFYC